MNFVFPKRMGLVAAVLLSVSFDSLRAEPAFVGTPSCAGCHGSEHQLWLNSHHDLAMQKPTSETVLGDFDNSRFEHFGTETLFRREGERFVVRTDGPDGAPTDYDVAWVFGVYPLQQYLLPLKDGRLQALSVSWDSRPETEGGQRWYHLYPDEAIAHDDPLHWTGPYQNWNTRCAECHSTNLQKNYDADTKRFSTRFFEEDVGCEGCHGPGSRHVDLVKNQKLNEDPLAGFAIRLAARGEWEFSDGSAIAHRRSPLNDQTQIDNCARCHARRGSLGEYHYGKPLADTHRLSLLGEPLYHHDGQILDEVYVYGSFIQSKMQRAGVVCSNCHEPHSNQLRAQGNAVCAQCHKPAVFDTASHHHHSADNAGAQCVSCHMPERVYMGVDARRDHSMRVPRPDLSIMAGTPNACTDCHDEKTADWALDALRDWGVQFTNTSDHPAVAMAAVQRGDQRGVPRLLELANDKSESSIWRATALERAASTGSSEAMQLAVGMLGANDPLLRVSAVRALQQLPPEQRYAQLAPMMQDPVSGVRMEAAVALAGTPLEQISDADRKSLLKLLNEYRDTQMLHADMPSVQLQLGLFYLARGDQPSAEAAYREALQLNPQLIAAYLNLADLLRGGGREEEARAQLQAALRVAPQSGDALHALGLLEARTGDRDAALQLLGEAAELESAGSRHRFVYAVAQHDFGNAAGALQTLQGLHKALPQDEQVLLALANYSAELGDFANARRYAQRLNRLAPGNRGYQQLLRALESRR